MKHVKARRKTQTGLIMKELRKCGILCRRCHTQYDGHYKYGWKKAAFDEQYTKEGSTEKGANWEQWKLDHLELSKEFDAMIEDSLA